MPQIAVALDGTRRRDFRLYVGDAAALTAVVYAHDGDTTPIAIVDPAIVTSDGAPAFTYGTPFVVSSEAAGRNWYRLQGSVDGVLQTLAWGYIFVEGETGGWMYAPRDGYWVDP